MGIYVVCLCSERIKEDELRLQISIVDAKNMGCAIQKAIDMCDFSDVSWAKVIGEYEEYEDVINIPLVKIYSRLVTVQVY